MNEEIGKVYAHINRENAAILKLISDNQQAYQQNMHTCQIGQLKVVSEFKLEVSKKITDLAGSVTEYVSAATEHEKNQEGMMKRMLEKTDNHETDITQLKDMKAEYDEEKNGRRKIKIAVWLAVIAIPLTWLKGAILGLFGGGGNP